MDFESLPEILRNSPNWCIAGKDKSPHLVTSSGRFYRASVTEGPWMGFDEAKSHADKAGLYIGFVLSEDLGLTCIDLDVKDSTSLGNDGKLLPESKWTSEDALQMYEDIIYEANSYTELSVSGKGVHVWIKGSFGKGRRRDGVEVYSKERFIVCTGKSIDRVSFELDAGSVFINYEEALNRDLSPASDLLDQLRKELGDDSSRADFKLVEQAEELEDAEIWRRASVADNAEKFKALCAGNWQDYGYPTQSEADTALLSMFTYYSPSNEQCRRMFRQTKLGQRDKATKDDRYLNRTLQLIRSREAFEGELRELQEAQALEVVKSASKKKAAENQSPQVKSLEYPPGFAGEIARFVFNSSIRPVKEVAIVSALGLLAGICGKAYNIPQSGLNLYIVLIARSGVGKEGMHSGISMLMKHLLQGMPQAQDFVVFDDFASGQALMRACSENPCFLNVAGEFGRTLARMAETRNADNAKQTLMTVMTNLYQKSGSTSTVGGISYSDAQKNVASVTGVAYSMIGETTPKTFYESLTDAMAENGFLSRFTFVEYSGDRPRKNKNPVLEPDASMIEMLSSIIQHVLTQFSAFSTIDVDFDSKSQSLLDNFDEECDDRVNGTEEEAHRQLWNRAHLKALRIAALLAVADNFVEPVVNVDHAKWAIYLVRNDISTFLTRLNSGDIGMGDLSRERKVISVIREYFESVPSPSYKVSEELRADGIITRRYLRARTSRLAQFTKHRMDASTALDHTIRSLVQNGFVAEVPKAEVTKKYGVNNGTCYRVLTLEN